MNARIFLPLLASTCFISNGYCSELFGKASTDINNAQSELIKELKESSSTINVSIFDLSLAKENLNSDTLTLKTTENTQVIYHKKSLTTSNGSSVWIGFKDKNNTSDLANNIVLVNHNGSIAASFRVNG